MKDNRCPKSITSNLVISVNKCYFRSEQKIEFRDVNDLNQILLTRSVAPHRPSTLYADTPSTLLYVDGSRSPFEVHWLDLSESKPKPAAGKRIIHITQNDIYDMCCAQDGDEQLLIVAARHHGLFAYNTNTGKLEWKVDRKPQGMEKRMEFIGVATDKRGLLFVCDYKNGNSCIHLFRASGGQYLGCLMRDEEELGAPSRIHWCEKSSSLITLYDFKNQWHINIISIHI